MGMLLAVAQAIGYLFDGMPIVRNAWRWLLERQLEVEILPQLWSSGRDSEIVHLVAIERDDQRGAANPFIVLHFALRFVNHRSDRKERVIGAHVVFKKKRLWLWKKEILRIPICRRPGPTQTMEPISNIEIEPMSAPLEIQVYAESGPLEPAVRDLFPGRFNAYVVLNMVGPMRRLERFMMDFKRPSAGFWDRISPG
jgi:hypothetical protein